MADSESILWLRRISQTQNELALVKAKARPWAAGNVVAGCLGAVSGFLIAAVVIAGVLVGLLKMTPQEPRYGVILDLGALVPAFGGWLLARRLRAAKQATIARRVQADLEADVERFAVQYPDVTKDLFRSQQELLQAIPVREAIAHLESQRRAAPAVRAAAPQQAKKDLGAGQNIGGCQLVRKLGEGAMGAVYQARHVGLDIPVAVKLMTPSLAKSDADAAERFVREARLAAKVKHQNIVEVLNVGQEGGIYFIVMELVEGGSLQDLLSGEGRLPIPRAISLISNVCEGLEFAHANGVIHRDLKPANIMIDRQGIAKIADMGLAKKVGDDIGMTQTGMAMGTPLYLAPEQALDAKHADQRSDIYSLGCMFYEMVTGRVPFEGDTLARIILAHAQAPIPDPRSIDPALPVAVSNITMKMMAKTPAERYQSVREVLDTLAGVRT